MNALTTGTVTWNTAGTVIPRLHPADILSRAVQGELHPTAACQGGLHVLCSRFEDQLEAHTAAAMCNKRF